MSAENSGQCKREYSYLSTITREFKLAKNQIQSAGRDGLVEMREVENPHNSEMVATIVKRKDVIEKIAEIRAYPKLSEVEKAARKVVAQRGAGYSHRDEGFAGRRGCKRARDTR